MRQDKAQPGLGVYGRVSAGASFSGNERNHLFMNRRGKEFVEISGVSGADDPKDARGFALLDFDRDGWQDLALVNANAPRFRLLRNQVAVQNPPARDHSVVALRFVGGNTSAQPADSWSARDGYGALVKIAMPSLELVREHRAGEGFSAQNSSTMIVGIGPNESVDSITVRWPSGTVQTVEDVRDDTLLTVYENPGDSPTGGPFVRSAYKVPGAAIGSDVGGHSTTSMGDTRLNLSARRNLETDASLSFYTTMATWCVACRVEMPFLHDLRDAFADDELAMFGIPIDPADSVDKLDKWMAANPAPYELLSGLSSEQIAAANDAVLEELRVEGVPATLITDSEGTLLHVQWGPPTISTVRELLLRAAPEERFDLH